MPKSSSATLIFRRSVARMVPSVIGSSYCLPVRLSVIVKLSATLLLVRSGLRVRLWRGLSRDSIVAGQPGSKIRELASLAAEGPPLWIDRVTSTVGAPRVRHVTRLRAMSHSRDAHNLFIVVQRKRQGFRG